MARRRRTTPAKASEPAAPPASVTLVPTGRAFIPGVPAVEMTVDPERAALLLAPQPPAFTVKPPPPAGDSAEEIRPHG